MSNNSNFNLKGIQVNDIVFRHLEDEELNKIDATFSSEIAISYSDTAEDYESESIVPVRVDLKGTIRNFHFEMSVFSEVEISDNSIPYTQFIEEERNDLIQPSLDKASLVLGYLYEASTGFPFAVDIHTMYSNDLKKDPSES